MVQRCASRSECHTSKAVPECLPQADLPCLWQRLLAEPAVEGGAPHWLTPQFLQHPLGLV